MREQLKDIPPPTPRKDNLPKNQGHIWDQKKKKKIQWTLIEEPNEALLLLLSLQISFKNTLSQEGNWYSM